MTRIEEAIAAYIAERNQCLRRVAEIERDLARFSVKLIDAPSGTTWQKVETKKVETKQREISA